MISPSASPPWCYALIDTQALQHNLAVIQKHCSREHVVAMLKSNAYGHGAVGVAQLLQRAGVSRFGVATLQEAVQLREAGITGTILLSGAGWLLQTEELIARRIIPLVSDAAELSVIADHVRRSCVDGAYTVHLKVDTGMSRMGVVFREKNPGLFVSVLQQLRHSERLKLQGMCTHFADADMKNSQAMLEQMRLFACAVQLARQEGLHPTVLHVANSAAILQGYCREEQHTNTQPPKNSKQLSGVSRAAVLKQPEWWVRPGGALYGLNPMGDGESCHLKPVLSWKAPIVLRKCVKKGSRVGYASTWTARRETQIAVLAVGYGDGYKRLLSNRGHVLIGGLPAPIVGRISMDLTTVDVTDIYNQLGPDSCAMGVTATLLGQEGKHCIMAWDLARLCDTIPYEICTSIASRVPRFYAGHDFDLNCNIQKSVVFVKYI